MKKKLLIIFPIIIILFIVISIIIGTSKEKEEYKLIELTGIELTNTLLSDDKISITYALYNDYDMKSEEFLEDLKKTSRQTQENIYYINTSHVTFESDTEIPWTVDGEFGGNVTKGEIYVREKAIKMIL